MCGVDVSWALVSKVTDAGLLRNSQTAISAVSWHCVVNMRTPSSRFTRTRGDITVDIRGDSPVIVGSLEQHKSIHP